MGFWDQLVQTGSAYVKHVTTIRQLLAAPPETRNAKLTEYVRGLSDASFAGFKLLLFNVLSEEKSAQAKTILGMLMRNSDAVRKGEPPTETVASPVEATVSSSPFDADLAFVNQHWVKNPDAEKKRTALVDFLIGIDESRYQQFMTHLRQMETNQEGNIRAHKANELNSWGRYFEDRMAYFNARQRTGQRDPKFMAGLRELEGGMADIRWVIKSCETFWPVIQQKKQAAAARRAAATARPNELGVST